MEEERSKFKEFMDKYAKVIFITMAATAIIIAIALCTGNSG